MSARFCQLDNNGLRLTNELGFILQDRCFSVVQTQQLVEANDCLCPTRFLSCLRVPCDLLSNKCQNLTLPLYDAKTRSPFKISAGTILENIIVMKRPNACISDCTHFVLGTVCGNDCDTDCDPQRWVSESCPISGAQLNKCKVIRVNAQKRRNLDCDLFLCKSNACPGQCQTVAHHSKQSKPCPETSEAEATAEACQDLTDENDCPCVFVDGSGCCYYPGGCGDFAGGELHDCMIGITLTGGDLRADDILIAVEGWGQACVPTCGEFDEDTCQGIPRWAHGSY